MKWILKRNGIFKLPPSGQVERRWNHEIFNYEGNQTANKWIRKYLSLPILREMQTKNTVRGSWRSVPWLGVCTVEFHAWWPCVAVHNHLQLQVQKVWHQHLDSAGNSQCVGGAYTCTHTHTQTQNKKVNQIFKNSMREVKKWLGD